MSRCSICDGALEFSNGGRRHEETRSRCPSCEPVAVTDAERAIDYPARIRELEARITEQDATLYDIASAVGRTSSGVRIADKTLVARAKELAKMERDRDAKQQSLARQVRELEARVAEAPKCHVLHEGETPGGPRTRIAVAFCDYGYGDIGFYCRECADYQGATQEIDDALEQFSAEKQDARRDLDAVHAVGWAAVVQREEWRTAYCESELRADRVRARAAKAEQERDAAVDVRERLTRQVNALQGLVDKADTLIEKQSTTLTTRDAEVAKSHGDIVGLLRVLQEFVDCADKLGMEWPVVAKAKAALGGGT